MGVTLLAGMTHVDFQSGIASLDMAWDRDFWPRCCLTAAGDLHLGAANVELNLLISDIL